MEKLKNFLNGFIFNLFINILVIFSIALLFLTRLVPFEKDVIQVLDTVDVIVLTVFSLEFILKLLLFGGRYFVREFGWIDLLSCIPVLTPIFRSFTQFKALRIARMIRFIRIIRVMRLFKSMQGKAQGKAEQNIGIRTNFFLSVASITMLFILATAITITVFIEGFIDSQRNLEMQFLINSLTDANIPQVVQHNLILGITVKREEGMSHYGLPVDTMERALTEDDFFVFPGEKDKQLFPGISEKYVIYFSNMDKKNLMNILELTIMVISVLSAFAIILTATGFLSRYVMNRVRRIYEHILEVVYRCNKRPLIVDNMEDEITELTRAVNRITDIYII